MFAGHILEPGRIELVEIDTAELPVDSRDEILFRPQTACLCGSDLPYFLGDHAPYPLEPGYSLHEMVGEVVDSSSDRFARGDRVLAVPIRQKGFFEQYRVDASRAIPWDTRCEAEIAVLAQPLGTVLFAWRKMPSIVDQTVAIVGQGPIGQLHAAVASRAGAREVIAIELLSERLRTSETMGATATVGSSTDDPVAAVRDLTGGRGADVVVECVGHRDQALDLCVELCRQAGHILYFGVPPETIERIAWLRLFKKNITVHTSVDPDFERDFPLAMRWVAEKRIDVRPLVTHRYPVAQIQKAYETFRDRVDGALKVIVDLTAK